MDYLRDMKEGFESGQLQPPKSINEVDFQNEGEVIAAYENVQKGAKGKFMLVMGR